MAIPIRGPNWSSHVFNDNFIIWKRNDDFEKRRNAYGNSNA